MHIIYSFHICTVLVLRFGVTPSSRRILCPLLNTTCCYAAFIYSYYNSYIVNIKGKTFDQGCRTTVLYAKNLKILWIKPSIYYTYVHSWLWSAVAFVDYVQL